MVLTSPPLLIKGIWDCLTNDQVVQFIRRGIAEGQQLHLIAENLLDNCVAERNDNNGLGCDNMTLIIVALLNGKTKEEWYQMVAERVNNNDGPVAPKRFGKSPLIPSLIQARFLGPQINQFKNWDNLDEASEDTSDEDDATRAQRYRQRVQDEEPWTEFQNGEDARNQFTWRRTPGRIIHLGDGSELLTDRQDDQHKPLSSSDDDSERENEMHVDGVKETEKSPTINPHEPPPIEVPESAKRQVLYRSPSPQDAHSQ
jgi:protein phosphatase PTC2/3